MCPEKGKRRKQRKQTEQEEFIERKRAEFFQEDAPLKERSRKEERLDQKIRIIQRFLKYGSVVKDSKVRIFAPLESIGPFGCQPWLHLNDQCECCD